MRFFLVTVVCFSLPGIGSAQSELTGPFPGPCTTETDWGADGTIQIIVTNTYDESGNVIVQHYVRDTDNPADTLTTYEYDEHGNHTVEQSDLRQDTEFGWSTPGQDGVIDRHVTYTYSYDERGNTLTEVVAGSLSACHTNTFDEQNNLVRDELDRHCNGSLDEITSYAYDSMGNNLAEIIDFGADGRGDWEYISTYDSGGNRITYQNGEIGQPASEITSYTYDEDGNLLSEAFDQGNDGTAVIYSHTYDESGNRLTTDLHLVDGSHWEHTSYSYDCWQ